jgi:hypothetical protein
MGVLLVELPLPFTHLEGGRERKVESGRRLVYPVEVAVRPLE